MDAASIAEDRVEELSVRCRCPICMESYSSDVHVPRVLSCGHSYCEVCIKKSIDRNPVEMFKCAECSRETAVEDATQLPTNFQILSMSEELVKSRADPLLVCADCGKNFLQNSVRSCMQEDCKNYNSIVCLNCAVDNHCGHRLVKYDQKIVKMREEAGIHIRGLTVQIDITKQTVLEKLKNLVDMVKKLEEDWRSVQIPAQVLRECENIITENDYKDQIAIADDLASTVIGGCDALSKSIQTAIDDAKREFAFLNDEDNGVDGFEVVPN